MRGASEIRPSIIQWIAIAMINLGIAVNAQNQPVHQHRVAIFGSDDGLNASRAPTIVLCAPVPHAYQWQIGVINEAGFAVLQDDLCHLQPYKSETRTVAGFHELFAPTFSSRAPK